MNREQSLAWEHLTNLEKSILSLIIVSEKTKQEASIVLNIYPYKFTEIYNRARKLFMTFTDYYELYETFLPPILEDAEEAFPHFIEMVVINRRKPSELVSLVPDFLELAKPGAIPEFWNWVLLKIQMEPTNQSQDFYKLLRVFDQWNNFRILPLEYRDPSPFPRRRNREFKKIHNQLNTISELGWGMIKKQFGTSNPPLAFIPIVDDFFSAMTIRLSKNSLTYCTRNKIPIFAREEIAIVFAESSFDFYRLKRVSTYSAQKFWANFRLKLQSALNHDELLNIKAGDFRDFTTRDKLFLRKIADPVFSKALPRGQTPFPNFN